MTNSMSCSHGRWCTRADALLGVEGIHVNAVTATPSDLVLYVETGDDLAGCPDCGVVAVGHGRRQVRLHDIPCFGRPVRLLSGQACLALHGPGLPQNDVHRRAPVGRTAGETDRPRSGVGD